MSLVMCYNKGCGKQFDPGQNTVDSCTHHPGSPVFHDAYKGWSCCNKKCTDFTEFLNIKGCKISEHNSEKPPEPQKYVPDKEASKEVLEVRPPEPKAMERPSVDTPLIELPANVAQILLDQIKSLQPAVLKNNGDASSIPLGTKCKNNACRVSYEGPSSALSPCLYHPGAPVFHEGLKYWSCCVKKTTEFAAFLDQGGCNSGAHLWFKKTADRGQVKCRLDWFQTGSNVVVSIFAKKYDPNRSKVLLSPVRFKINLYFPEDDGTYEQDIVLGGIVNVAESSLAMFSSKVELTLHKAEVGAWSKLEFTTMSPNQDSCNSENRDDTSTSEVQHALDTVDLSDL